MNEVHFEVQLPQYFLNIHWNTKGMRPVRFIDAPSTKVSRVSKTTGSPVLSELYIEGEPSG
jgi:hypothetical protein